MNEDHVAALKDRSTFEALRASLPEGTAPDLSGANLCRAHLAHFDLSGCNLCGTDLRGADLSYADLRGANLNGCHLEMHHDASCSPKTRATNLRYADLSGTIIENANFDHADLSYARLQGTRFFYTPIRATAFRYAIVDGETLLQLTRSGIPEKPRHTKQTDFTGVGLGNVRLSPQLRTDLEYNIRRLWWRNEYRSACPGLRWAAIGFWSMSDYGRSTARIVFFFWGFVALFSGLYLIPTPRWFDWPEVDCKPFVAGESLVIFAEEGEGWGPYDVDLPRTALRSIYFSVVVMTTLGFGEIHAAVTSPMGQVLVIFQVFFGYVLLGALITRFSAMAQGTG